MQVSKGLKRATGRDEQFQHHLGTLNFRLIGLAGRPVFPMAASSNKIPLTLAPLLPLASGSIKPATPQLVLPVTKVDFAANPIPLSDKRQRESKKGKTAARSASRSIATPVAKHPVRCASGTRR
jgi:hypothetical protein